MITLASDGNGHDFGLRIYWKRYSFFNFRKVKSLYIVINRPKDLTSIGN